MLIVRLFKPLVEQRNDSREGLQYLWALKPKVGLLTFPGK